MGSLLGLSLRHARVRPGRTALNLVSVVLGVALSFGVSVAMASILDTLHRDTGIGTLTGDVVATPLGSRGQPLGAGDVAAVASIDGVVGTQRLDGGSLGVDLRDGTDVSSWLATNTGTDGLRFVPAAEARVAALAGLGDVEATLPSATLLGLLVGGYLIHLTFTTSVVERRREFGTLRALGASRRDVLRVVLGEAVVIGFVGAALGLALGLAVATGVAESLAGIAGTGAERRVVPATGVVAAAILGIVTPVAAALGPGRRAARVDPVDALRGSQPEAARDSGWWLLGAAMLGVMIASVLLAPTWQVADRFMRVAGGPLMIAGAILLVPKAMPLVATRLRPLVGRLAPGVGEIAMHHVTRERNRSANTSGIMMVVVAMVLTFGAMAGSWRPIVVEQVERQFGADVVITTADGETDLADLATTVEASGVATAMTTLQQGDAQLLAPDLRAVPVVAVDGATYFRVSGYPWSSPETTDEGVARALAGGGAVILPELLRSELGFELGEAVTVATAAGPRRLTLAGSYLTFGTGDTTSMVVDRADASALGLDTITSVAVDVPNGDTGPLDAVLADRGEILEVRSTVEQQAQVMDRLDGVLALVLMVVVVSLLVGALAIASTMTVSVLARVRELGILRSVGARRREVQAMVVAEAAVLAVVAVVLGTLLGAFVGWVMVNGLGEDFANPVPYTFPWAWLGVATVIALTTAALASVVPGRRATSIDPVTALAHE